MVGHGDRFRVLGKNWRVEGPVPLSHIENVILMVFVEICDLALCNAYRIGLYYI